MTICKIYFLFNNPESTQKNPEERVLQVNHYRSNTALNSHVQFL